jgi:uncharacterized protein YycO
MKIILTFKKSKFVFLLLCLGLVIVESANVESADYAAKANIQGPLDTIKIDRWLDFDFDPNASMGSAKNPAVILPATMATLFGDLPAARRAGDVLLMPAAEFQKIANQPLTQILLAPVLSQLTNVKSFDGFSAVDTTGLIKGLPSELYQPADALSKRVSGENPVAAGKLLQNGDLVFGSHVANYMTWGRYNHVGIVANAARGEIIESTASIGTDKPGVRSTDWTKFASDYAHVGIVRVRGASSEQLSRVVQWVTDRKGKPYRWPIIMGLDKNDESRFYCSQLVWRAYKQVMNIDLDSDGGVLIFPDDIYYSKEHVDQIVP